MESRESCLAAYGRAWKVDGRAQALVGPGLATPLCLCVPLCVQACVYYIIGGGVTQQKLNDHNCGLYIMPHYTTSYYKP